MEQRLRGCVQDFQAGSGSTPTDFFEMLMKFDGSPYYIEITEKCHIVLYTYSEICLEIPYTAS